MVLIYANLRAARIIIDFENINVEVADVPDFTRISDFSEKNLFLI